MARITCEEIHLWFGWVLTCGLSFAVYQLLDSWLYFTYESLITCLIPSGVGALVLAVPQWLLLRQRMPGAAAWVPLSVGGYLAGYVLSWVFENGIGMFTLLDNFGWLACSPFLVYGFAYGLVGLVLGAAQWLLFQLRFRGVGWWIPITTAGFAFGWLVSGMARAAVSFDVIAAGLAYAIFLGGPTASLLIWLLRHPR